MERVDLVELHFITPMDNVQSILARGILSHARAASCKAQSVAMPEIQERRAQVVIPGGRRLHDYANLYICARNPMLYKRLALRDTLCVLSISTDVLDLPGTIIADQNAASDYVRFAAAPGGLKHVDKERTFAEWWTDPDPIEGFRKKAAKCAEVLVPDRVPPAFIRRAYVASRQAKESFDIMGVPLAATVNAHLFFQ